MKTNYQFNSQNSKKYSKENQSDSSNLVLLDHQLLKNLGIEKMNSKEICSIIISKVNTPTSRIYFEKKCLL